MRTAVVRAALVVLVGLVAGCNIMGPLLFLTSPPQIQKAQFKLTKERLAVFVDFAQLSEENPVFLRAFHDRLVEVLRDKKVNDKVIPLEEVLHLRQANPDLATWDIQKIGRELHAEQVLYVRVQRLNIRAAPDHPVIEPLVEFRLKVIGTAAAAKEARLWPGAQEREGKELQRARHMRAADDPLAPDEEATKLGKDAALLAAMPFYDVDLEEPVPWEK